MNGPHDLGGRQGFGALTPPPPDDKPWTYDWEGRMHVMALASQVKGYFVLDEQRHACERLPPAMYLHCNYYERWYAAVSGLLVEKGVLTAEAIDERTEAFRLAEKPTIPEEPAGELGATLVGAIPGGASAMRETDAEPKFAVDAEIVTVNLNSHRHNRLPSYVKAKRGTVTAIRGAFTFNDSLAHGGPEAPTYVYTVAFNAGELWGATAEAPEDLMYVDLFEPYLLPAPDGAHRP